MVWLRRILMEYGKISNKNGLKEKIHLYINKSIKDTFFEFTSIKINSDYAVNNI